MTQKVCMVTGGSSGIGAAAVEALQAVGFRVFELSRREQGCPGVSHFSVDVTDETAVRQAVEQIEKTAGRIDLLVNCAGYGISGAVEFTALPDAKQQMEVNFFGMVNSTKAALPRLRKTGGRVINVSSVAARIPIPFQTFYSASKAAINSYTFALANEVRPFGISVTAVQPGDIATGFTAARNKSAAGDDVYGGRISRSVAVMERDEKNGMAPQIIGCAIAKIACKKRVKPLYTVGFSYRCVCFLERILPCRLLNFIIGKIYAK